MDERDTSTFYPNLRQVLDERFAALPDDELEALFMEALGEGITPAEYEEFFAGLAKGINRISQKAVPLVAPIAKGVVQGAVAGSAGGPLTALTGGILGGTASALQQHGRGPTRNAGKMLSSVVGAAGALRGGGVSGLLGALGQGGAAQPAISALRGVLGRPETGAALRALMAGRNQAIPIGVAQTPVPAHAFAGLLGALAREAEAEADAEAEVLPGFLLDTAGQPVVDPTVPEERAARLLQLLATASLETETEAANVWDDRSRWEAAEYEEVWADLDDAMIDSDGLLDVANWPEVW